MEFETEDTRPAVAFRISYYSGSKYSRSTGKKRKKKGPCLEKRTNQSKEITRSVPIMMGLEAQYKWAVGLWFELDEIQNLGPFTQSGGSQGGNTSTPPVPNRISKEKCNKVVSILMS